MVQTIIQGEIPLQHVDWKYWLVIHATRTGDEIWILAGSNFPFILRPLQNGHYELVCEIYIHGIMNGEVVWLENNLRFTDIILE